MKETITKKGKPANPQPIVFYRPGWMVAPQSRCAPHTQARRQLFRQYVWQLPQPPVDNIKDVLNEAINSLK